MELTLPSLIGLSALVFLIAALYSSIGHGGASGYLAVLSLFAIPPQEMASTALILNVLVAGIACVAFLRAGHLSSSLTWPFVVVSVPAAFLGGMVRVASQTYFMLLAAALVVAAVRLALPLSAPKKTRTLRLSAAMPAAGGIGLLSGIVGIGGGVFLSPLMLLMRWADPKKTAATAACFVVANSAAALGGRVVGGGVRIGALGPLLLAALLGGVVGSHLGANSFSGLMLRRLLAVVLVFASVKLLLNL